jgi:hypothetical protein
MMTQTRSSRENIDENDPLGRGIMGTGIDRYSAAIEVSSISDGMLAISPNRNLVLRPDELAIGSEYFDANIFQPSNLVTTPFDRGVHKSYLGYRTKYAERLLVDREDVEQLSSLIQKMVSKPQIELEIPLPVPLEKENLEVSVTTVGFFVSVFFGFLVILTLVLRVQFIHPVVGITAAVGGAFYMLMGIVAAKKAPE